MAEDTSQDRELAPSAKRLAQAREQGQFAQSRDLTTFVLIVGFFLVVTIIGPILFQQMRVLVQFALQFNQPIKILDHANELLLGPFAVLTFTLLLIILALWLLAIFAPLALAGFRPVFALKFDLSKLDPILGIGRIISINSLLELVKNLMKITFLMGVGLLYLYGLFDFFRLLVQSDLQNSLVFSVRFLTNGIGLLLFPLAIIALFDGVIQWLKFQKQLKMSPEEMKQETKESEGSPEIKQRLRQKQRQIAASRMMAAIERADVVLANPDHYSVALRYDPEKMSAPIIVARGTDALALRIQEVAKEHQVPIAQIPPLARYLYSQLEIGEPIPITLFEAIAKILAWAYETKEGNGKAPPNLPKISFVPEQIRKNRPVLN